MTDSDSTPRPDGRRDDDTAPVPSPWAAETPRYQQPGDPYSPPTRVDERPDAPRPAEGAAPAGPYGGVSPVPAWYGREGLGTGQDEADPTQGAYPGGGYSGRGYSGGAYSAGAYSDGGFSGGGDSGGAYPGGGFSDGGYSGGAYSGGAYRVVGLGRWVPGWWPPG